MPNFNEVYSDKLIAFFRSDIWKIIKYRSKSFIDILERSALDKLNKNEIDNASYYAHQALGVKTLLDIAERIPSELLKGQLAVDDILGVIEKKPGKKEKSWTIRILERLKIRK